MSKCPFCDFDISKLEILKNGIYCPRCKNQIVSTQSAVPYIFGYNSAEYSALKSKYKNIMEGVFNDSFIKRIIITDERTKAFNQAITWAEKLVEWHTYFDENGCAIIDRQQRNEEHYEFTENKVYVIQEYQKSSIDLNTFQIEAINDILDEINNGWGVRALNVKAGCEIYDRTLHKRKLNKRYLRTAQKCSQNEFFVFISAVMKKRDRNGYATNEYTFDSKVAQELKNQLFQKGLGAFWWQGDPMVDGWSEPHKDNWQPSAQIATGLALSSIFIGLAYDVTSISTDGIHYDCLLKDNKSYSKSLRYEFDTFKSLVNNQGKKFLDGLRRWKIPKKRVFHLVSKAMPASDNYNEYGDLFTNGNHIIVINQNHADEETQIILTVKEILGNIYKILDESFNQKLRKLEQESANKRGEQSFKEWFTTIENTLSSTICSENVEDIFLTDHAVPADFFFRYSVIDKFTGESVALGDSISATSNTDAKDWYKSDKKILFFLEQYYLGKKRKFRLNMVVRDWNQAFMSDVTLRAEAIGVKQKNQPNSNIFTDPLMELSKYSKFRISGDSEPYTQNSRYTHEHDDVVTGRCCAVLFNDIDDILAKGQTQGEITFFDKRDQVPGEEEKTYEFAIILRKREAIEYEIKDTAEGVLFEFKKPLPSALSINDIHIFTDKNGYIPCLIDGRQECKNAQSKLSKDRRKITTALTRDKTYRLMLSDNPNFYLSFQVSNTQIDMDEKSNSNEDFAVISPFIRCPLCADILRHPVNRKAKCSAKNAGLTCDGKEAKLTLIKNKENAHRIVCAANSAFGNINLLSLPKSYEKTNSLIIHLLGNSGAGKSVFLSRLFAFDPPEGSEVEKTAVKAEVSNPQNTEPIRYEQVTPSMRYLQCVPLFREMKFVRPEVYDSTEQCFSTKPFEDRFLSKQEGDQLTYTQYSEKKYSDFIHRTRADEQTMEIPFMFSLKNRHEQISYLSLFDIPGGNIIPAIKNDSGHEKENRAIMNAEALILLCNGAGDENARNNISEAYNQLKEYIKAVKFEGKIHVCLAIVLCKFDLFEMKFASGSAVKSLAPTDELKYYQNSKYEKYINLCSEEIKSYLLSVSNPNDNIVNMANENFIDVKYFAVSSSGNRFSLDVQNQKTYLRFVAAPRGLEHVIAWITSRTNIVL